MVLEALASKIDIDWLHTDKLPNVLHCSKCDESIELVQKIHFFKTPACSFVYNLLVPLCEPTVHNLKHNDLRNYAEFCLTRGNL